MWFMRTHTAIRPRPTDGLPMQSWCPTIIINSDGQHQRDHRRHLYNLNHRRDSHISIDGDHTTTDTTTTMTKNVATTIPTTVMVLILFRPSSIEGLAEYKGLLDRPELTRKTITTSRQQIPARQVWISQCMSLSFVFTIFGLVFAYLAKIFLSSIAVFISLERLEHHGWASSATGREDRGSNKVHRNNI